MAFASCFQKSSEDSSDCDTEADQTIGQFKFFDLPYIIQIDIISHLCIKDTLQFMRTCNEAKLLCKDNSLWKKKLWYFSKAIVVNSLSGNVIIPNSVQVVLHDKSMIDYKKLCLMFYSAIMMDDIKETPNSLKHCLPAGFEFVRNPLSGFGLIDYLHNFLQTRVYNPPTSGENAFTIGEDAPSFMIFGPPETFVSKELVFNLIASKNSSFEPVGLVKRKVGGIGSGVTVQQNGKIMNFVPIRRARQFSLLIGEGGDQKIFRPEVAEVVKQMKGLVYYIDAKCTCKGSNFKKLKNKHNLDSDMLELNAMLRSMPDGLNIPILILLICAAESRTPAKGLDYCLNGKGQDNLTLHTPEDLFPYLKDVDSPWMVSCVQMPHLEGVQRGINWMLER